MKLIGNEQVDLITSQIITFNSQVLFMSVPTEAEEVNEYEDLGIKQVIWVEANPDVFEEMRVMLTNAEASVESHAFQYAASTEDHATVEFNRYYGPDAGYLRGNKGCSSLLKASLVDLNPGIKILSK